MTTPTKQPLTGPTDVARRAARLSWGRRLRHPATPLVLLGTLALVGAAAVAVVPPSLRHWTITVPASPRPTLPQEVSSPVSAIRPVAPAITEGSALQRVALVPSSDPVNPPAPAPLTLSCHVVAAGLVEGTESEWSVELILDEAARNRRGALVLPSGLKVLGRVRLDRAGSPTPWVTGWRLTLPEGEGAGRELELQAVLAPDTRSISKGTLARLIVRGHSRIGERRGDEDNIITAVAVPFDRTPVETLTGRPGPREGELPRP